LLLQFILLFTGLPETPASSTHSFNAVRNGKKVTTVVELQARFDEQANILWGNRLMEEGVKVIYGVPGLKVQFQIMSHNTGKK